MQITTAQRKIHADITHRLRELFELGAELAGEIVALLAVVPVLLPLVHILGVLLLGSPLCAVERRRADDGQDARSRVRFSRMGRSVRSGARQIRGGRALTFVAELLELVVVF